MRFLTMGIAEKVIVNSTKLHHFQKVKKKEDNGVLYISCQMEDGKKRCFEFTDFTAKDGENDELLTALMRNILVNDPNNGMIYAAALIENENIRHINELSKIYSLIKESERE